MYSLCINSSSVNHCLSTQKLVTKFSLSILFFYFYRGIRPRKILDLAFSPMAKGENYSSQGSTNDPLFVHHSDSTPTAVLVTPLLSGDNYGTWLRAMTMALRAKNKLGIVDGSITPPKDFNQLLQWKRCNDLVSSWILNSTDRNGQTWEYTLH